MKDWSIISYTPEFAPRWNEFNAAARNATFLTDRRYMDYHSDRFTDRSLIALKRGRVMALLPADITADGTLHSHRGLTYGGWILPPRHLDCGDYLELWEAMADYCRANSITALDYKPLPAIYAKTPSDEELYALFRSGATLSELNISAAIRLDADPGFNASRRQRLRQCRATGYETRRLTEADDFRRFHAILAECLQSRHGATPVHSADELLLLASRFPRNIELWGACCHGEIRAATLIFISDRVVHSQYIATTPAGREENTLTGLIADLIERTRSGAYGPAVDYFDFGISNEDHGRVLNSGLYSQKASMGASAVAYPRYMLRF